MPYRVDGTVLIADSMVLVMGAGLIAFGRAVFLGSPMAGGTAMTFAAVQEQSKILGELKSICRGC